MRQLSLTIFYQFDPWHSSIGGVQTVIRNFIKFAPPEFVVRLVGIEATPDGEVGKWQRRKLAGRAVSFFPLFRLIEDDSRRRIPTSLRYALSLRGKNFASDFMHFHRLEPSLFTGHWSGQKTLFVHNDIHQQMRSSDVKGILWRRFPQLYFSLERRLMPQFTRVLSCNSESTALYRQQYPQLAKRISFVRNCFDGDVFYPLTAQAKEQQRQQLAAQMGLNENTRFLLFAGRLHPQKDPLLLLEAFSHVSQAIAEQPVHLLIAGSGELMAAMRNKAAQLDLSRHVTFLGSVPYQQLADLQRLASVFVLTSAYEGLPLVVLEALACGTPVVTTQAGETPRLLGAQSGIVCDERSPQSIAQAIQTVLQNPNQFTAQACIQNADLYSAKTVVEEVYEDMRQQRQPAANPSPMLAGVYR